MKQLESFRELLLKKAGDASLENLVAFVRDDVLADLVIESLEKMARAKHKGDAANAPIRDFGVEMDPETEPKMMHDALSHHASQYKAALKGGNQDVANQHAKQIFRISNLADQAQKHSQGKLNFEAVSPHAWERQGKPETFGDRIGRLQDAQKQGAISPKDEEWLGNNPVTRGSKKPGQFVTDTKAWNYKGPDFGFLKQQPHESYANEIRRHGHDKAYPLEQMKVNGQHLDVQDVDPSEAQSYKEHPFDKHPIMNHFEDAASSRTPEKDAQWRKEHQDYQSSPHMDQHFDKQAKLEEANPEAYANRGKEPSAPVHDEVDPLDVKSAMENRGSPGKSEKAPAKEAAAPEKELSSEDKQKAILDALPPSMRASFLKRFKDGK